jgi:polyribonucleotide 5'-hydroxyl-kinase
LVKVGEPVPELHGAILAVMSSGPGDGPWAVRAANVLGFVFVSEVDVSKQKLKLLAPLSGQLPSRVLVWGSWPEQMELDL